MNKLQDIIEEIKRLEKELREEFQKKQAEKDPNRVEK